MATNSIDVKICNTIDEAPDYVNNGEGFQLVEITKAVIVRNGTIGGNDTIDLQFSDGKGNKFVGMVTANLLKTVADLTITNRH